MATGATTNDNRPTSSGKTPPCHKIRLGPIKAVIWKRDADKAPIYNATFARLFVDNSGNWAESTSFGRDDLLVLAKVADAAHTWICEQQQRDRQGQDTVLPS
jgi:hypothetical protein